MSSHVQSLSIGERNALVLQHDRLLRSIVKRFLIPGHEEDMLQVARSAALRVAERFQLSRGLAFSTYLMPSICGEMKRYHRDKSWSANVPRALKELALQANNAEQHLSSRLGRKPTLSEVSDYIGVESGSLAEALSVYEHYRQGASTPSHAAQEEGRNAYSSETVLGQLDKDLSFIVEYADLRAAIERLTPRHKAIIQWRFFEEVSQVETAHRLGYSQMHISRLERQALRKLRALMEGVSQDRQMCCESKSGPRYIDALPATGRQDAAAACRLTATELQVLLMVDPLLDEISYRKLEPEEIAEEWGWCPHVVERALVSLMEKNVLDEEYRDEFNCRYYRYPAVVMCGVRLNRPLTLLETVQIRYGTPYELDHLLDLVHEQQKLPGSE